MDKSAFYSEEFPIFMYALKYETLRTYLFAWAKNCNVSSSPESWLVSKITAKWYWIEKDRINKSVIDCFPCDTVCLLFFCKNPVNKRFLCFTEMKKKKVCMLHAVLTMGNWIFIFVGATLVCALMKGNPTLHLRKSKSTSPQEIPFSSCKKDR